MWELSKVDFDQPEHYDTMWCHLGHLQNYYYLILPVCNVGLAYNRDACN